MQTNRRTVSAALLVAASLSMVACSSGGPQHAGDIDMIRSDPSPAMHTLAERDSDRINRHTLNTDTNFRMISDDWDRLWMIDRPSHLTFYPVAH